MLDMSNRALDEVLGVVISTKGSALIKEIGVKTVTNRIVALIENYGLTTKDCPYLIILAAALFLGSDVKTPVDEVTK